MQKLKGETEATTTQGLLTSIKNILEDFRDEGEYRYYSGVASTTPTDIDIIRDFGFPIKGFWVSNERPST